MSFRSKTVNGEYRLSSAYRILRTSALERLTQGRPLTAPGRLPTN
jgi:hypothetical protein